MISVVLSALFGSFAMCVVATWLVRRISIRWGFIDHPGGHKAHTEPVALGGGVGIYLCICVSVLLGTIVIRAVDPAAPPSWLPGLALDNYHGLVGKLNAVAGICACATVLFVVGLIDDRKPMGPVPKFAVQFAVAVFTALFMNMRIAEALPDWASILTTVLWIVLITNAFNFLDNMDGLSAGVAAIAAAVLAIASWRAGQIFVPVMACVTVGGLAGFLVFNFAPARIFMGDAGSLVIGYWVSILTILTTFYDPRQGMRPLGIVMPLVILAVPLYDVLSVVVHRIRAGDSPFKADRRHFSHRLQGRGMTTRGAVLTIYLATAATALPAIALAHADWMTAMLLLAQCVCVVAMISILEHTSPDNGR
jgi:UDP-GlcNAc:undecaprenyl-phosphate GlcNAc-1-phosphate transferase